MTKSLKKIKYALYKYSTENIGDEIQSIAARRFLPQVDYYIDRDRIGEWKNANQDETVKLIANGWYMRDPFMWPPTDKTLNPLLISMYVEPKQVGNQGVIPRNIFLTNNSKRYLKKYGPVGARDEFTLKFLQNNGIESYFSGCITLTIQKDPFIKKRNFILAIDISDQLYDFLSLRTSRRIIRLSPYGDFELDEDNRLLVAEYFLYLYQSAHAIVTTRLHATLPSLALKTPVLLIRDCKNYDPNRYAGLDKLARSATEDEYIDNYQLFDLDNPADNPTDYLSIREDLIRRCSEFTGYNNKKTFMSMPINELLTSESLIDVFADSFHKRFVAMINDMDIGWYKCENARLSQKNSELINNINDLKRDKVRLMEDARRLSSEYKNLMLDYNKIKTSSAYYLLRSVKHRLFRSK